MRTLREQFGDIDIYLFDQLLRGRIQPGMLIVDAGCGFGRNLVYLLREGFEVHGVDGHPGAVAAVRALSGSERFHVAPVQRMPFSDAFADVILSSAVLHFARDEADFDAMLGEMWRILKPRGLFFARLASSIGIEDRIRHIAGRRFALPDGSERYLVDEALLMNLTRQLGGQLLDPLKTTVVQNQRSMTTWVVRKDGAPENRGHSQFG